MVPKTQSIGRRFSYTLIGVVTVVLVSFAVMAIMLNIARVDTALEQKLANALSVSQVGLKTLLWTLDHEAVKDFVESLFLDDAVAYAQVLGDEQVVASKVRHPFREKDFDYFSQSPQFKAQTATIFHEEEPIGVIQLAVSRATIKRELMFNILGIIALTLLIIVAISVTSLAIARRYISRPLAQLQHSATLIANGDLDVAIETRSGDEIGLLAQDLNAMRASIQQLLGALRESNERLEEANCTLEHRVAERTAELAEANAEISALNERLTAENLRMGAELEITRQLQQMILPAPEELEAVDGLDIAGYMVPADEVGGDYYDVLEQQGRVKIGIGDVTGHGLESGMVMLMTQMAVRTLLTSGESDPVRFLDILNRTLCANVQRMGTDKNLTLALLDYANGEVRLSGQHEELIVVRREGTVERVDTIDLGFPIGLDEEIMDFIHHTTVRLAPGDGVVLYTDGITEAENAAGEQYGLERLCAVVRQHWSQPANAVKEAVIRDVYQHIDGHEVYDDITLVVVKQQ